MADGANISPEQGGGKPPPVQPPKNEGLDKMLAEKKARDARFADMVWGYVQKETTGEATELTKPGVSNEASKTVAKAAREGLLSDRQTMETFYKELEKWTSVGDAKWKQGQVDRLLNELRVSQGKPPVVPAPPQAPQPAIEVKNRSRINPLNWFTKKRL